jgi:hypothetical protein
MAFAPRRGVYLSSTTINLTLKMPFGISPAPEYFQQFLEREIENLPGARTVADDIIIYGEGDTVEAATVDHDRKLKFLAQEIAESILGQVRFQMAFSTNGIFRMEFRKSLRNLAVRLKSHARIHF